MSKHKLKGVVSSRTVWLDGVLLSPRRSQEKYNHSPDGFNWGYGGSGPAQLALAIMLELTDKPRRYQQFKWDVIAKLPQTDFEIEFDFEYGEQQHLANTPRSYSGEYDDPGGEFTGEAERQQD